MRSSSEISEYQKAMGKIYPSESDLYCVINGLKVTLEQSDSDVILNVFYNGWQYDHFVSSVIAFALNGRIIACALGRVYEKLRKANEQTGATFAVNSDFGKVTNSFF